MAPVAVSEITLDYPLIELVAESFAVEAEDIHARTSFPENLHCVEAPDFSQLLWLIRRELRVKFEDADIFRALEEGYLTAAALMDMHLEEIFGARKTDLLATPAETLAAKEKWEGTDYHTVGRLQAALRELGQAILD